MKTRTIASASDPNDPRPWADLDLADGSLDINVRALNGLAAYRQATGRDAPPGWQRRPDATSHTLQRSTDTTENSDTGIAPADETHVLAVTEDGDLEFVPRSQQRPRYYAHLAWWEPATGEWTRLEFIE